MWYNSGMNNADPNTPYDYASEPDWVYTKPDNPSGWVVYYGSWNHYFFHGDFWREDEDDIHADTD